jgi:hypothetical protein
LPTPNRFALLLAFVAATSACSNTVTADTCEDINNNGICDPFDNVDIDVDSETVVDDCVDLNGNGVCDDSELCPGDGDADGDGICNAADICPGHDDTHDFDQDGIPNGCDRCPADPGSSTDADGDGVCDAADICNGFNDTADYDADGVPDGCDDCPLDNPDDTDLDGVCDANDACEGSDDTVDTDADGTPDGCDDCPEDAQDDRDGDGICDSDDVWPDIDNADDFDADGIPDDVDPCPTDVANDSDNDGSCDSDDLCPDFDDTADSDGDGDPDACDLCPEDNPNDSDGDGICDSDDACEGSNDGLDTDSDGIPDGCDDCPLNNPDDSDEDGTCDLTDLCPGSDDFADLDDDGVPDGCDRCPADAPNDTDGDGVCDSDDDCPMDYPDDTDLDGVCDSSDPCPLDENNDIDGDGVCDSDDPCPFDNPDDQNGDGECDSDVTLAPIVTDVAPGFGNAGGGYLVQITGENFLAGVRVEFGKEGIGWARGSGTRVLNAGTLIQILAPPFTPGLVDVVITNTDGRTDTATDSFEYIAPEGLPDLEILDVLPERGPRDGGYLVSISGKGFVDGVEVFWGHADTNTWTPSPSVSRFGPTLLRAVVPNWPEDETVDIRVTQPTFPAPTEDILPAGFTFGPFVVLDAFGQRLPNDLLHNDTGVVLIDANGDNLQDIFVLRSSANQPDELYIQSFDDAGNTGFFVDQTETNFDGTLPNYARRVGQAHDYDRDGDMDVVHVHDRGLGVWVNDGAAGFTWTSITSSYNSSRDFVFADLDCDGLEDIALVIDNQRNRIFKGDGAGNFVDVSDVLPAESEPSESIAVADVDDDGDMDLMVGNDTAIQNRLYYNNCANADPSDWGFINADYGTGRNFPTSGFNTRDATFTDVNGDGWLDAVLVNFGQSLRIYLNDGSGNFGNDSGTLFPQSEDNTDGERIAMADFDADGDLDMVIQKRQANGKSWPSLYFSDLAQGGAGAFTDVSVLNMPEWRDEDTVAMAVGDLDNDLLTDMFLLQGNNPDWLFINDGLKEDIPIEDDEGVGVGILANNTTWGFPEDPYHVLDVQLADIDGDDDLDVALGHEDPEVGVTIWLNDGTGQFFDQTETRLPDLPDCQARALKFVDLNNDDDLDLFIVCHYVNWEGVGRLGGVYQLVNDGNGYFTDVTEVNQDWVANGYYTSIEVLDLDNDGDQDAYFGASNTTGKFMLSVGDAYNNGGALYLDRTDVIQSNDGAAAHRYVQSILTTDLNYDGFEDMYLGISGQNRVFYNDQEGHLVDVTSTHLPAVSDTTRNALAFDLDEDDDKEVYVINNGTNRLHIGELDYKFADATATALPEQDSSDNRDGSLIDVDQDGLLDLVTGVWGKQNTLYVNVGGAQFQDFTIDMPKDADYTSAMAVGDLDGNGEVDLFVGNRLFSRIYLNYTNDVP